MNRVCLIGHGFLGKWHAQKILQNSSVQFSAIVEANVAVHEELRKLYPQVHVASELSEMISLADIFLVVVPTSLHFSVIKQLLPTKKHLFVEKPLTATWAEAQELKKILPSNLVLQVGHSERCHGVWEILKEEKNILATSEVIRFERYAAFKGRASDVNVVLDVTVHDLDLMMYLFNPELVSCRATTIKSKTNQWDTVSAEFVDKQGRSFQFYSSRDELVEVRSLKLSGSQGTTSIDLLNLTYQWNSSVEKINYAKRDHLLMEQSAFFTSIHEGLPAAVDFHAGYVSVYLVECIIQAAKTGSQISVDLKHFKMPE
jgi:predicted dehydrogenase